MRARAEESLDRRVRIAVGASQPREANSDTGRLPKCSVESSEGYDDGFGLIQRNRIGDSPKLCAFGSEVFEDQNELTITTIARAVALGSPNRDVNRNVSIEPNLIGTQGQDVSEQALREPRRTKLHEDRFRSARLPTVLSVDEPHTSSLRSPGVSAENVDVGDRHSGEAFRERLADPGEVDRLDRTWDALGTRRDSRDTRPSHPAELTDDAHREAKCVRIHAADDSASRAWSHRSESN